MTEPCPAATSCRAVRERHRLLRVDAEPAAGFERPFRFGPSTKALGRTPRRPPLAADARGPASCSIGGVLELVETTARFRPAWPVASDDAARRPRRRHLADAAHGPWPHPCDGRGRTPSRAGRVVGAPLGDAMPGLPGTHALLRAGPARRCRAASRCRGRKGGTASPSAAETEQETVEDLGPGEGVHPPRS